MREYPMLPLPFPRDPISSFHLMHKESMQIMPSFSHEPVLDPVLMRIYPYRLSVGKDDGILGRVEGGDRVLDPLRLLGHDLLHRHLGFVQRLEAASNKSP